MNKRIAILETSPAGPLPIHDPLRNHPAADFFFVTHDEEYDGGTFNPTSTWIENRNLLFEQVQKEYDWYFFTDYDVLFDPPDFLDYLLSVLDAWNPAIAFPWYTKQGEPAHPFDITSGVFGNNMAVVFHRTVARILFPLPTQFGGFWDGASFVNVNAAMAWTSHVLQVHGIHSRSLVSSDYAANENAARGKANMQTCYEWQKEYILRKDLPRSVHELKIQWLRNPFPIVHAPKWVRYDDASYLAGIFDLNHPHWKGKKLW